MTDTTWTRTDHSTTIETLRLKAAEADAGERVGSDGYTYEALLAASDLLEIHDATGLNLGQAPRIAAFVEDVVRSALGGRAADNLTLDNGV